MPLTNTHIHTPYSFSAFDSIEQAVSLAKKECIEVLGISDFNTMEGYGEFATMCEKESIFPLYNIEFIAFSVEDKQHNLRWNDPKNPGIVYFCGKALTFPSTLSCDTRNLLNSLWKGTQDYIWKVITLVNEYCCSKGIEVCLDYCTIRSDYAKNTVRERHVAKALSRAVHDKAPSDTVAQLAIYKTLFNNPSFGADVRDSSLMQNEIRNQLLKAGKPAYVEEKPEAFLPLPVLKNLIVEAGGIPCYPVLADEQSGLTEYEQDVVKLAGKLIELGIFAVEFIPLRNGYDQLKKYVHHFHERGFCVTFGTEHNTPDLIPMAPAARGGHPFDEELVRIGYEGSCILAAHQEQRRQNRPGYVDETGNRLLSEKQVKDFIRMGDEAIRKIVKR